MVTLKQIAANQRNAVRSSGPRSPAGKARSRFNATRHGLTAHHVLLPGESFEEFEEFRRATCDDLCPQGELEIELADRVVALLWRMRRIPRFEAALFAWLTQWHGVDRNSDSENSTHDEGAAEDSENDPDWHTSTTALGQVLEAMFVKDFAGKLTRYEAALQRQLALTLKDLRQCAASRQPQPSVLLPTKAGDNPSSRKRHRLLKPDP